MNVIDAFLGEFIDVIDWPDDNGNTLVYRFPRHANEIKYGAELIVRESQSAVLVNEGRVTDVFGPGRHRLETQNLPVLTTLLSWPYGFKSPFKAEVYFCSMRRFTDLKWGTKTPIMLTDDQLGPVRLRSYGTYTLRVSQPLTLIREITGTRGHFHLDEITEQLRNLIVSELAGVLGRARIPVLELAANFPSLNQFLGQAIAPSFANYGLEIHDLRVENVALPEAVENLLDKRTGMGLIGDLDRFHRFQSAEALTLAAQNPAGNASGAFGMAVGLGLNNPQTNASTDPPALPDSNERWYAAQDQKRIGPFSRQQLTDKIQTGLIHPQTQVWRVGFNEWQPAGTVPELKPLFTTLPPPLPPSA